ncbi:MAG: hypothetical protein JNM89_12695 [Hyphomicrobiaceae bacterium]|nr:hypothetical protein [Hyphomicrobiaceae bacterium]
MTGGILQGAELRDACRGTKVARSIACALAVAIGPFAIPGSIAAQAEDAASAWVQGHMVRTRLLAGGMADGKLVAGVVMEMADGWKSYWRTPGDAGGVPPSFDWSRSGNLASAKVLYPAPRRMVDKAGTTIGYKGSVVFPVLVEPADPARPVDLKLDFSFGTCHDICVPGESAHEVEIGTKGSKLPDGLVEALSRVPTSKPVGGRPELRKSEINLSGAAPSILLHVVFADGAEGADAFAEGPDGEYVPIPKLKSQTGEVRIYEIDLTEGADVAALQGKSVLVTLVSSKGQSEVRLPLE